MAAFGKRRSFAEAVERRRKIAGRIGVLVLVFLCYEVMSGAFVSAVAVGSASMEPTARAGDFLLATPLAFGPITPFGKLPGLIRPRRGDLVVADPNFAARRNGWVVFADAFVRFFTFQRISIPRGGDEGALAGPYLARVVALPGDAILMEDHVFKVKPEGESHFLTEFELSSRRYDISLSPSPVGWIDSMPGSAAMPEMTLGKDEFFLAGDARSSSSDSRTWGPVRSERLRSLVFLRYWPLGGFGAP